MDTIIRNIPGNGPMLYVEGNTYIQPATGYKFYADPERTKDLSESDVREVIENYRQYAIANLPHDLDLIVACAYLEAWLEGREYQSIWERYNQP